MATSMLKTHPDFLSEFGDFAILFSHVEHNIKDFIGTIINPRDRIIGEIMTAGAPFKGIWHCLMSLYRHVEKESVRVSTLESTLQELDEINNARNDLIHATWSFSNQSISRTIKKARFSQGLRTPVEPYSLEKLRALSGRLFAANIELLTIHQFYKAHHR